MKYQITGGGLPVAVCTLSPGEAVKTQSGGMSWMSPNMRMKTQMEGIGKAISRRFAKESAFLNYYTPVKGTGLIAFASSFPGEIIPFNISPQNEIIIQKRSFLAAEATVDISVYFQKKLGAAIWGGEGFVMQRLTGKGTAFAEIDGSVTTYELGASDQIILDTGYLAAMSATCSLNIVPIPGAKNLLFGGEGVFNTIVNGPGKVWIQSIPINRLVGSLRPHLSTEK